VHAAEIAPIPPERRTQPALDVFFVFAGANIVATTVVTGASLVPALALREALLLVIVGVPLGSALVAALVPVGSRLGVPSMIAARAALGVRGGQLLALLLYATNFAWIALNNVIAASAWARLSGGGERVWSLLLGLLATLVVSRGPRAVALAARAAVPLMGLVGLLLTGRALAVAPQALAVAGSGSLGLFSGLDVVAGYQVSWILMFADYSRYTASGRGAALAAFSGLTLTSLWLMPLGALGAVVAGTGDPGALVAGLGGGTLGVVLLALATVTTNFVNIYLSALAWKSVFPETDERISVWTVGLIGTALALLSHAWLDRYADFMALLGALLVPIGGVLIARFYLVGRPLDVAALYARPRGSGLALDALLAWALGAAAFVALRPWGGTLPALATALAAYWVAARRR
jgi:purine-cytosine permease-like protein